jgi:hypothetical protein
MMRIRRVEVHMPSLVSPELRRRLPQDRAEK